MKDLLPIGHFAQITRLSPKALRLYDEMGLLPPAVVDTTSGYRYYRLDQIGLAARIRRLRSLEMPLDEIGQVVRAHDPGVAYALIARHRARLAERIARDQRALAALDALAGREGAMAYTVAIAEVLAQPILYIRASASLGAMDDTMPCAIAEIHAYLQRAGVRAAGPDLCVYPYPDVARDDFAADACVPIERPIRGEGRIMAGELPAGPIASTVHAGPYEDLPLAFRAVLGWIRDHGHDIIGPLRETYVVGLGPSRASVDYRTEVAWPIR